MDDAHSAGERLRATARRLFRRSLHIFPINAGSCNGCESESASLLTPPYDLAHYGIAFVATPHHADMLLVTGVVTRTLRDALLQAYQAMPAPKLVAAIGACACTGGVFRDAYTFDGPLDRLLPVDVYIPGCPPSPQAILHGLLLALGRAEACLQDGRITPRG